VPIRGPNVSHPFPITLATDEELVVPPRSTAITKRTFRDADVLRGLAVELPHGDETVGEKKKQGCEDSLVLSGEFSALEDVIIVIPGSDKGFTTLHSRISQGHTHAK